MLPVVIVCAETLAARHPKISRSASVKKHELLKLIQASIEVSELAQSTQAELQFAGVTASFKLRKKRPSSLPYSRSRPYTLICAPSAPAIVSGLNRDNFDLAQDATACEMVVAVGSS